MNGIVKPRILLALSLAAALAAAACSPAAEPPLKGAQIGGPLAMTDEDGRAFDESRLEGRYRIVYFGFTHCPDICPTDLARIGQALRRFETEAPDRAARVQPLFVTVDPERDTPAVVKEFTDAFHPRLIGLTGTPAQLATVARDYGIYYKKQPSPGGGYVMNHSQIAYLFGPKGEPIALLPHDGDAEAIAAELDRWVK